MGIFRQFPYSNFHDMNMDEILKIIKDLQTQWAETSAEWNSYKDFIDNYFAELDVSAEVLQAMRTLASTGELNTIIDPVIAADTAAWLAEHITVTQGETVLDTSLSIAGAAADAKAAGDRIGHVNDALKMLNDVADETMELTWELGGIDLNTGNPVTNRAYTRTPNFYNIDVIRSLTIFNNSVGAIMVSIFRYKNGEYQSRIVSSYTINQNSSKTWDMSIYDGGDIKISIHKPGSPDITIPEMDGITAKYITGVSGAVKYKRTLTAEDLFADLTENGIYASSNAISSAIADAPTQFGGVLIVLKAWPTTGPIQVYYTNNSDNYWYWRYNVTSSWNKINKHTMGQEGTLTEEDTFADTVNTGIYAVSTATATAIEDSPTNYGGVLIVARAMDLLTPIQLYYTTNSTPYWYWRYSVTGEWFQCPKGLTPVEEQESEYFVQTCIDRPITINANTDLFIFGDSIAATSHGGFTWGSLIAEKFNCTEHNYAVSGSAFVHGEYTTGRIIDQVNAVTNWNNCDLIIVAAGTNDAVYNTGASDLRAAVLNVINAIRAHAANTPIVFITPMQRGDAVNNIKLPKIAGAICNVALQNNCSVINGFDFPFATHTNDWVQELTDGDGLHPSAATKTIYARCVLNALL